MAKFSIKWGNGKEEVAEQSDCKTVEQFINTRFGSQGAGKAEVTKTAKKAVEKEGTEEKTVVKKAAVK